MSRANALASWYGKNFVIVNFDVVKKRHGHGRKVLDCSTNIMRLFYYQFAASIAKSMNRIKT